MGSIEVNGTSYRLDLKVSIPDLRDWQFQVPEGLEVPDTIDLASGFTYDQGAEGSCTGNAQAKLFRMALKLKGFTDFEISRAMIYYNSRAIEGTTSSDAGSTIGDSIKGLNVFGACSEQRFPYIVGDYATKPPAVAYTEALDHQALEYGQVAQTEDAIGAALALGYPVSIGFVVYQSFQNITNGLIPMPAGGVLGAHNMGITGRYHSRRLFIVDNSWSEQWGISISGTKGRALMPYDMVLDPRVTFELRTISNVEGVLAPPPNPVPTPVPTPTPETDEQALRRILGVVTGVDVRFSKYPAWPLAIQAPPV